MVSEDKPGAGGPKKADSAAALLVRDLVRTAWKATLSTLDRQGGYPYASLVAVATAADGSPLVLLSGLAEHTKNIAGDKRASILFDGTSAGRAALTGPRVTVVGRITELAAGADGARQRYLARHPDAAQFIDFADFRLLSLEVEWAHMVAGFGRIVRLTREDVVLPVDDAADVLAAEAGVLQHMNEDHADAVQIMAALAAARRGEAGEAAGPARGECWQMIGCDPEGVDLTDGQTALRVRFPQRVTTIEQVRKMLIVLVDQARAQASIEASKNNGSQA